MVTITGTNDAPVVAAITQSDLTEQTDTLALTTDIAVSFGDVDLTDVGHSAAVTEAEATGVTTGLALEEAGLIDLVTPGAVTKASGSDSGTVTLGFSAASTAFDYLSVGEVVTLTYTAEIDDGDGGVTPQTFVVTITGTNDAPVVAAILQSDLIEQTDTLALTTDIAVSFNDVDLTDVGHSAAVTEAEATGVTTGLALEEAGLIDLVTPGAVTKASGSDSGTVTLGFSAASTAFDYLSVGEVVTLTYTVAIDDGDGGVTPQTFVVTITGTNDAPVVAAITQSDLTEQTDTLALTTDIAVSFGDVDLTDVGHSAAVTEAEATGVTTGLALEEAGLINLVTPGAVTKASGSDSGTVTLGFSAASTAFDYLSVGEVVTLTYTVAINDGEAEDNVGTQTFVVTITGTNDAPVVAAITQSDLTEQTDTLALTTDIAVSFGDVDLTDVGHSAAVTEAEATGVTTGLALEEAGLIDLVTPGAVTKASGSDSGTVTLGFSAASTAFDYLSVGEVVTLTYTAEINDGDGGVTPQTFVVTITGTNDAPVITSGPGENITTGEVTEDAVVSVTGNLAAADVDNGAVLAWTLEGGANVVGNVDYSFAIDKLTIVKNGVEIFTDDFGDGAEPPSGGLFANGDPASYGTSGVFTESGGRAIMDGSLAGPTQSALFTSTPFSGHTATLRTNRSDAIEDQDRGLKSDDNFTVEGQFDLVVPDENREGYGIRLSDRIGSDPAQQGDDVMELLVRRNANGDLKVSFRERDFTDGTVTTISSVTLDPPVEASQIVLRLDHDLDNPGAIAASFDFLDTNGVLIGSTVALPGTGQIFNGETWTRAQIVAFSPGEITSSSLEGDYGTISINADGQWTYDLDNDSALVQGLDEGQTLTDTFTAVVTDQYGASDTQEVTISITGTDEPIANVLTYNDIDLLDDDTINLSYMVIPNDGGFAPGTPGTSDVFEFPSSALGDVALGEPYTIGGFTPTEDALDLSSLLALPGAGYTPGSSSIEDYVQLLDDGTNTKVQFDADGPGTGSDYVDLAVLDGITGADEINIVTTSPTLG